MNIILTAVHIVACLALIIIVLLQQGKGASMGAAFGGSSQTIFGSSGATPFLGKVTTVMAVVFMLTSLTLAFFTGPGAGGPSVVEKAPVKEAPASPAPAPAEKPAE